MIALNTGEKEDKIISLNHMYQDYFLDYASYVILERAVPAVEDGLKPVQRRILHALREMDDGRFHKVANVIGQTMQFHPHGDASITDALVHMGQKDLLIDCQGNWGDVRTGDSAAAARYIEARLTKFALEVIFNAQTTNWQLSYDGRKKEPVALPVKFPLLLVHGVEGIAVGLSTKILPHNFIELIEGSIAVLRGQSPHLLPDFRTGGMVDVANYNAGKRGGKVRVRAKIEISKDKKSLIINELPYGTTTGDLIESILKAVDKGKIKIKKVVDNTAANVEIGIELMPGTSPDVTVDALYAFTDCEMSISPNACIIVQDRPHFLDVHDILTRCTFQTRDLLKRELEIRRGELEELMHFASLEKVFIENRIYHKIETAESWEQVLEIIPMQLKKFVVPIEEKPRSNDKRIRLFRPVNENDVARLTEIKIKRISKYNAFAVEEYLQKLQKEYEQVKFNLDQLNDYSIQYFENLLKKYGKGRERKTEIRVFDTIQAAEVVANNAKLYANFKEGFIGLGLKKDDFISDCSDIDDIIVFRKDGKFQVVKVADKVFVGKDLIHVAVWRKGDERTTYNLVYLDGKTGVTYAKRFNVTAITRSAEYDLTQGNPNSRVLYFTSNPNSESEIVEIGLSQSSTALKKVLAYDFAELAIKGRTAHGNIVSKYPVRRVTQKEAGKSTIGAKKIWMDSVSGKLNADERGQYLGEYDTGDKIIAIYKDGTYEICEPEINKYFEINPLCHIGKWDMETVVAAVYFDGNKEWTMVKRFKIETSKINERFLFVTEHKKTQLLFVSVESNQKFQYSIKLGSKKVDGVANLDELAEIKGWKAIGNKMTDQKLMNVSLVIAEAQDAITLFDA